MAVLLLRKWHERSAFAPPSGTISHCKWFSVDRTIQLAIIRDELWSELSGVRWPVYNMFWLIDHGNSRLQELCHLQRRYWPYLMQLNESIMLLEKKRWLKHLNLWLQGGMLAHKLLQKHYVLHTPLQSLKCCFFDHDQLSLFHIIGDGLVNYQS